MPDLAGMHNSFHAWRDTWSRSLSRNNENCASYINSELTFLEFHADGRILANPDLEPLKPVCFSAG